MIKNILKMKYCSFLLILLSLIACSGDDNDMQDDVQETMPLGNFTVVAENITPFSAEIMWTLPENSENTEVVYSVYLDGVLQQENITNNTFLLEELNPITDYTFKVIASNDASSIESSLSFTTTEIPTFLVKKIEFNGFGSYYGFSYNEENQMENILYRPEPNDSYFDHTIDFAYDSQGRLVSHQESGFDFIHTSASFIYSGNNFDKIDVILGASDHSVLEEYEYATNFNSYSLKRTSFVEGQTNIIEDSENTIVKDGQNRLISHHKIDAVENFEKIYEFEYQNDNLTKISDSDGNVWEITYDNKVSFINFYSGNLGGDPYPRHVVGLHSLNDTDLLRELSKIPDLIGYVNKNNPLTYRKNGSIYRTIQYEYNQFGYPVKCTLEDGTEFVIEYEM